MKQTNPREKTNGMRGMVKRSSEPVQRKPVFRCPVKYDNCDSYWFELSQHRLEWHLVKGFSVINQIVKITLVIHNIK
jgi:hypothetical protein